MAVKNVTQLHRISFRKKTANGFEVLLNLEADDLGQDTQATFNVAPRKSSRSSSVGTSEKPIPGTFDSLSGSITMLLGFWKAIGKALGIWNEATYAGADAQAGNMVFGDGSAPCSDGKPTDVVIQGLCDDGSTADVEFTRCFPSLDDDLEVGASDTQEVTIALNPQIFNATDNADDGLPQYTVRMGDNSLTSNQRYNAATGEYADVVVSA